MQVVSESGLVTLERRGGASVMRIANPPVNAVSPGVIRGILKMLDTFDRDTASTGLILACAGRTFVAGGDIASFEAPDFTTADYNRALDRLEASRRPVVAALFGTVLGGGFELALACHWRVATAATVVGLPEVKLGLLPGSLGTQRLPRLAGMPLALDLIASGRTITASAALDAGIVDLVVQVEGDALEACAASLLTERAHVPLESRRASRRDVPDRARAADLLDEAAQRVEGDRLPASKAIVRTLQAGLDGYAAGEVEEARQFDALRRSPESLALRHLFFAEREAAKTPVGAAVAARPVRTVGVVGAGTMGRGIAMNFLNAGLPTVLLDTSPQALQLARDAVRGLYEASARKGRLDPDAIPQRMALLSTAVDDAALAECDLVIEAVYEDMALKREIFGRLGRACRPGAILATNTSTLDVDHIAAASGRPEDVVGLHFFSPANVMRLLEVVRGDRTSAEVLATAMALSRRIGKVAVVSGVCWGFIGNRMLEPYVREADRLILEGASPCELDAVMESFGMAMGPCRMLDMAGLDVAAKVVEERAKAGTLPADPAYRALVRRLAEGGRFGQKTGAGHYRYDGRTPLDDPSLRQTAETLAREYGIARRDAIPRDEILERLLYPLINEGARILEEGVASRGGDIDVVWAHGYGYPRTRGGPLFTADAIGLERIVTRLTHHGHVQGNGFGHWTPSALLVDLATRGGRLSNWSQQA
jgi:3-hydroxyacyl-CoA dehydrogenase